MPRHHCCSSTHAVKSDGPHGVSGTAPDCCLQGQLTQRRAAVFSCSQPSKLTLRRKGVTARAGVSSSSATRQPADVPHNHQGAVKKSTHPKSCAATCPQRAVPCLCPKGTPHSMPHAVDHHMQVLLVGLITAHCVSRACQGNYCRAACSTQQQLLTFLAAACGCASSTMPGCCCC
jgi:hypothetical protein